MAVRDKDVAFVTDEPYCTRLRENRLNEIAEYVDKITYVNREFKLEKAVEKKLYEREYGNAEIDRLNKTCSN